MTIEEIKNMVNGESYDFLRTNPHLKDRIIFLTLGGSHAYGTNNENSDVDVRGCALNSVNDILGMSNFEQVVNTTTDTTIYSFNKLIKLLISCNPNTIELLGCKPEHYFYITDIGKELIDNRKIFLSKKAVEDSFGGYATQQLRRLENAIARDKLSQEDNERHIRNSMQRSLNHFIDKYGISDGNGVELFIDKSNRDDLDCEIFCKIYLDKIPARDFTVMLNSLSNVISSYGKLNHRNHKKDDAHLNKHAMHLIRLYLMAIDILEKEEINTYRENDIEFLLSIRNGRYQNEDGTYHKDFFDIVSDYEKRLVYAKENSSLPMEPNMELIEEFTIDVNRRSLDV